jgi:hypothetical protein
MSNVSKNGSREHPNGLAMDAKNQPILRPALDQSSEEPRSSSRDEDRSAHSSAFPQQKRKIRPGWKATIVRAESFAKLRAIQKSTTDPAIDLSYLTDACVQMALEQGSEAIVQRVFDGFRSPRKPL